MVPTRSQIATTREVVRWYLTTHYRRAGDVGLIDTFVDPARVGAFAVSKAAIESGESAQLFRLLVTVAMFQRLRDTHVMGILRRVPPDAADELTTVERLVARARTDACRHALSPEALAADCSLRKDEAARGTCAERARGACYLHGHTELLRRYGHFGKVPTSAALVVERAGDGDLNELRRRVYARESSALARAQQLESVLSESWRISDKIASMYLSLLTVPDLGLIPPWREGLDWTWFVVVDQNVDAFLTSIGYAGGTAYVHRRAFVRELASRIDLTTLDTRLEQHNPRLVQQAMYLFMSRANRQASPDDCMRSASCSACPRALRQRCPVLLSG